MKVELTYDDQTSIILALQEYIRHDIALRRHSDARLRIRSRIALIRKITVADHNARTALTRVKSFNELRGLRIQGRQWLAKQVRACTEAPTVIHGPGQWRTKSAIEASERAARNLAA